MLTELDAVNEMLGAIREAPVSSLDSELSEEAALALSILRKTSRDVQKRGWHWNTDRDVTLTRDVDGKITLPVSTLQVQFHPSIETMPAQRGQVLWDPRTATDVWTSDLVASQVIRELPWTSLPNSARDYVCARAARSFSKRSSASPSVVQEATLEEQRTYAELHAEELRTSRYNALLSPGVISAAFRNH